MKTKNSTKIITYVFLIIGAIIFIGPLLFTFLSSLKNNNEIFSTPFALPSIFKFSNYLIAWNDANMSGYFVNSILISFATVAILVVVSTLAAYPLSRFDFKISKWIILFFMIGMMVPMHTVLVPVSYLIGYLNLKNNLIALVLLYVAFSLPFSILVLSRFMKSIPDALEEAALIDGASYFTIYRKIIIPLSLPAISTISIFNFLGAWNNVIFPLLFINDDRLKPISLGLLNFSGERGSEYGPLMAAIMITIFVPLVIYLVFQEKVEGGLAAGAVKE